MNAQLKKQIVMGVGVVIGGILFKKFLRPTVSSILNKVG